MNTDIERPIPTSLGVDGHAPVIIDLGKKGRKQVKQLRKGKGKLLTEIASTVEELKTVGTISATAQPIIIVVRERFEPKGLASLLKI